MTWLALLIFALNIRAADTATSDSGAPADSTQGRAECLKTCDEYYKQNPKAKPENTLEICPTTFRKVLQLVNPLNCYKGYNEANLDVPQRTWAYVAMVGDFAQYVRSNGQAFDAELKKCDPDPKCRLVWGRQMFKFMQKDESGNFVVPDAIVLKEIGREKISMIELVSKVQMQSQQVRDYCQSLSAQISQDYARTHTDTSSFRARSDKYYAMAKLQPICLGVMQMSIPVPESYSAREEIDVLKQLGVRLDCYGPAQAAELMCYAVAASVIDPTNLIGTGIVAKIAAKAGLARLAEKLVAKASARFSAFRARTDAGAAVDRSQLAQRISQSLSKGYLDENALWDLGYHPLRKPGQVSDVTVLRGKVQVIGEEGPFGGPRPVYDVEAEIELPKSALNGDALTLSASEQKKLNQVLERGGKYVHPQVSALESQARLQAAEGIGKSFGTGEGYSEELFTAAGYVREPTNDGIVTFRNVRLGSTIRLPQFVNGSRSIPTVASERAQMAKAMREGRDYVHPQALTVLKSGNGRSVVIDQIVQNSGASPSAFISDMKSIGYDRVFSSERNTNQKVMFFRNRSNGRLIALPNASGAGQVLELDASQRAELAKALRNGYNFKHSKIREDANLAISSGSIVDANRFYEGPRAAPDTNETTQELIENYERKHGVVITQTVTDDFYGAAYGSRKVEIARRTLKGDEAEATSTLVHEITHNTSTRHLENGRINNRTVGRTIDFWSEKEIPELGSAYGKYFPADEVEARIRQIGLLQSRGSEAIPLVKQTVQDAKIFVKTQEEVIQSALNGNGDIGVGYKPNDFRKRNPYIHVRVNGGREMFIYLPKDLKKEGIVSYTTQVLENRLNVIRAYDERLQQIEHYGYIRVKRGK